MEGTNIILKYLHREFENDNPAIYLYAAGGIRSRATALGKVVENVKQIFIPGFEERELRIVARTFLDTKRNQYLKGEITVKPIYSNTPISK